MKGKGQAGQAFILVLILLAIGALLLVPALRLTDTSLKTSRIIGGRAKSFYATDAAQEFVMWKLLYTNYISSFTIPDPLGDTTKFYSPESTFTLDVCGAPVNVSVIMRAIATWRGVALIGNTPIKPTITVSPSVVNPNSNTTYTYTIKLEQISDNTSQGLDAVYIILPTPFVSGGYITNSSQLSVDGGNWQTIDAPLIETGQTYPTGGGTPTFGQLRIRWPNPYTYGQNNFASPMRNFSGGQVKEIKFQISGTLGSISSKRDSYYYSWAVLKPWSTLSGSTGAITVQDNSRPPGTAYNNGLLDTTTSAVPSFIPAGQSTNITYTIAITDQTSDSQGKISNITDYLPPGFRYIGPVSGSFGTTAPTTDNVTIPGRWRLVWNISPAKGFTTNPLTLTFKAITSENISGSYFNEVTVASNVNIPKAFMNSTYNLVSADDFNTGYTWNSAAVIVPAYDSSATSGNVTTDANLAVTTGGVSISSYQVK